jgi:predicted ATPase/signal transduction histidine kinase/DNA-binding response OmpR family regulator
MHPENTNDSLAIADDSLALSGFTLVSKLEHFHTGPRHRLYRVPDGARILKMTAAGAPGSHELSLVHREFEILRRFDARGIVRVFGLIQSAEGVGLLMEDAGATNLAQQIRAESLSIADFLEIGIQVAESVSVLHDLGIIHRDINPSNIVWQAQNRRATLIDFALASPVPVINADGASPKELEGTLAYVSPEQTGRTGHAVDTRTDLYSLGATFYELLTGLPPFSTQDAVELIHAHLARAIRSPHELRADLPLAVSQMVCKLLEKEPDKRYQTAKALVADLRQARIQWEQSGAIIPFPLAIHDAQRKLGIPDKLYGRHQELQRLEEVFARSRGGGREVMLLTGAPGIGKSALVNHLGRTAFRQPGLFAAGKFDQLQRSVPFSGLAQAFRGLVRQLATESEPVLATWRERIQAAIEPNGRLVVDLVPELEHIIGAQPALPEVGPVELKNRFQFALTNFLRVFAQAEHPLTLFLDDLQWVDAASLQLLEQLIGDNATHHLLLLGAYRDREVDSSHPLALTLAQMRKTGTTIDEIHVGPFRHEDVVDLVTDTFGVEITKTQALARVLMNKADGNPFFVRRLLHFMPAQGLIRFAPSSGAWEWDSTEIERAPITDNVLELMVLAIERLPSSAQRLLQIASCIGHRFDIDTLAELSGLSQTTVMDQLWPALEDRLVLPVRGADKAYRSAEPVDKSPAAGRLEFAHDRLQEAAYGLLNEERRRETHLSIGRHWLTRAGDNAPLEEELFDIVDQLDLGEGLISELGEHRRLVELNLAAARKARASAAYTAAFEYLTVAFRHLTRASWQEAPQLTFSIHREMAECAYLIGKHPEAEKLIETALHHAPSRVAKADLYSLRVLAATVAGDWLGALRWGRDGLRVFGLEWPLENIAAANEAEALAVMANVGARRIEDLVSEPEVSEQETRACMRLISILGPPAYFSGAEVLTFLVTRAANLSLIHGPSEYSAYAYVFYGAIHNARTGEYDVGFAFGKLALALASRFGNRGEECRTLEVFGLVVQPWKAALRDSLPLVKEGFRAGVESGELAYAAFNLNSVLINGLPAGVPLAELAKDAEIAIEFAAKHKNQTAVELSVPFRQIARVLMDEAETSTSFDSNGFNEAMFLEEAGKNQTALGFYWVARLQVAYLFGDYGTARRSSKEAEKRILAGILGMVTSIEYVFYSALTLAAGPEPGPDIESSGTATELTALYRQLEVWAEHCPQNFAHKLALVGAEIARLNGAPHEALKLYRAAIDGAARGLFIQDEALAHELRARFFLAEEEPVLAGAHFRVARERYHRWGATRKVRAMERARPEWFMTELHGGRGISIDALALVKASQAISAETEPERLFEQILRVAVEVAGAQRGTLVLRELNDLTVRARVATADRLSVSMETAPLEQSGDLPATIFRHVLRLKEVLLLSDAASEGVFATDPAVQSRAVRSVLCVPLTKQATVIGMLYLENNELAGAFNADLVEVVQVLASQAVIALENSTLLVTLQQLTGALEQRVAERSRQLEEEILARGKAEVALQQAQKMEAIGRLTGGVAHDFNNLLQVIGGNVQLLGRHVLGNESAERRLQSAAAAISRGSKLASQLLAFGRRQPLAPKVVNIGRLIRNVDEMLRRAIGEGIEIETIIGGGLWNTAVDPVQVENALLNLAINARDAMAGQGKLTIEAGNAFLDDAYAQRHIDVSTGQYVVMAVTDTGCGIPADIIDRVFEPFFTTKPEGQGSGLGLSMVYGFVKQSGGHVKVYSELGQGTTIRIYLPRSRQAEDAATEVDTSPVTGGTETVLVAEDDEAVRNTVVDLLTEFGYRVLQAKDAQGALAIIESGAAIDLLFTDVVMPGPLRSPELARRAAQRLPTLGILFTSGYTQNAIVHGGRLDEGIELLSKPYTREELGRKVRQILRHRQESSRSRSEFRALSNQQSTTGDSSPSKALRILLVENQSPIRQWTSDMLANLGHSVIAVSNDIQAVDGLDLNRFDVLMIELALPGALGEKIAAHVVKLQPGIGVIFSTARGITPSLKGRLARAVILPKPYDERQIAAALKTASSADAL